MMPSERAVFDLWPCNLWCIWEFVCCRKALWLVVENKKPHTQASVAPLRQLLVVIDGNP